LVGVGPGRGLLDGWTASSVALAVPGCSERHPAPMSSTALTDSQELTAPLLLLTPTCRPVRPPGQAHAARNAAGSVQASRRPAAGVRHSQAGTAGGGCSSRGVRGRAGPYPQASLHRLCARTGEWPRYGGGGWQQRWPAGARREQQCWPGAAGRSSSSSRQWQRAAQAAGRGRGWLLCAAARCWRQRSGSSSCQRVCT
jgi:hypothetical protein